MMNVNKKQCGSQDEPFNCRTSSTNEASWPLSQAKLPLLEKGGEYVNLN